MKNIFFQNEIDGILENIYVLSLNDDDIEQYEEKIVRFSTEVNKCDIVDYVSNSIKNKVVSSELISRIGFSSDCRKLCDELVSVIKGDAPLIELELLGYILSKDISEFKTYSKEYSFIDIYINDWVDRFEHPETAYAILYLLSEYKTYSIDDIRLASFEPRDNYNYALSTEESGSIIQSLYENFLISSNNKGDNVLAFEAAHQYVAEQFRKYCQGKEIPENLKYYIDHLRKSIESRNKDNEYKHSYKSIDLRYSKYYSKHIGIYITMALMAVTVFIINILKYNANNYVHYQLIAISLVDLPSIYYIYNYCVRFFLISNNIMVKLTYIIGPLVIILSYIFINAWGILLGIEIVVLSLSILLTFRKRTLWVAKRAFKKDFIVFLSIGLAIIALGIIHYNIFSNVDIHNNDSVWLTIYGYSNYAIFIVYVMLSITGHIKYSHMIGRIGLSNISK